MATPGTRRGSVMSIEELFMDSENNKEEFLWFSHTDIGDVCDSETESDSDQGGIFEPSQAYDHPWLPEISRPPNIDGEASQLLNLKKIVNYLDIQLSSDTTDTEIFVRMIMNKN